MREEILHQTYDEERSLYNLKETDVLYCIFAGPHDGESVLKECRDINVKGCKFSLRYPLWHAHGFRLIDSNLDEKTRAPIWYSYNGSIVDCTINGIKCLRECKKIDISGSKISSPEFGWKCREVKINDSFKKIVITSDIPKPFYNDQGILIMNVYDFLLNADSLEL